MPTYDKPRRWGKQNRKERRAKPFGNPHKLTANFRRSKEVAKAKRRAQRKANRS